MELLSILKYHKMKDESTKISYFICYKIVFEIIYFKQNNILGVFMQDILLLALFTEAIWETLKLIKTKDKINYDRIGATAVGILIAVAANVDIFSYLGRPLTIKYLGAILTGILISRGSNFIHDLLGSVSSMYQRNKP